MGVLFPAVTGEAGCCVTLKSEAWVPPQAHFGIAGEGQIGAAGVQNSESPVQRTTTHRRIAEIGQAATGDGVGIELDADFRTEAAGRAGTLYGKGIRVFIAVIAGNADCGGQSLSGSWHKMHGEGGAAAGGINR